VALKEVTKIPVGQVPKRNTTALLPYCGPAEAGHYGNSMAS
jgi:hypothetical protein